MSEAAASGDSSASDRILLAGAGRMGGALLDGWIARGVEGSRIAVIDPNPSESLRSRCGAHAIALNPETPRAVETLLLAVKPQMIAAVAPVLEPWAGPETTIVSVLAGTTLATLTQAFPRAGGWVRAMPNLPAAVGRGVTGVVARGDLAEAVRIRVARWLGAVGRVEWLRRESEVDAVTAVSGSGPAYVFLLAEALGRAGERLGLAPDLAARLARATVEGAGELMFRTPETTPAEHRRNVTSPGGTTAAALSVLMADDALGPLLDRAVEAAFRRAGELSA